MQAANDNAKVHGWKAIADRLRVSIRKAQSFERLAEDPLVVGEDHEGLFVREQDLASFAAKLEARLTRQRQELTRQRQEKRQQRTG